MGPPLQKAYATGQEKIPRGNPPGKRGAGPPEDQQAQKAEVLRNPGGQRLVRPHVRWGCWPKPVPTVPTLRKNWGFTLRPGEAAKEFHLWHEQDQVLKITVKEKSPSLIGFLSLSMFYDTLGLNLPGPEVYSLHHFMKAMPLTWSS